MQRYLVTLFISVFFLFIAGCQSPSLFGHPLNTPFVNPQMNLAQSVQEALLRDDGLAVAQVHVETRENVVILRGYVKKIRQSDTAEQIARQVPGVESVENYIIIRP